MTCEESVQDLIVKMCDQSVKQSSSFDMGTEAMDHQEDHHSESSQDLTNKDISRVKNDQTGYASDASSSNNEISCACKVNLDNAGEMIQCSKCKFNTLLLLFDNETH